MSPSTEKERLISVVAFSALALALILGLVAIVTMIAGKNRKKEATEEQPEQTEQVGEIEEMHFPDGVSGILALPVSCAPGGIMALEDGSFLISDIDGKCIWRVAGEQCELYAGADNVANLYGIPVGGYYDSAAQECLLKEPWAVAPFLDGVVVSDSMNRSVRILHNGVMETLGGEASDLPEAFERPTGLAVDPEGNLYLADTGAGMICKISREGHSETFLSGLEKPTGLFYTEGTLLVAESGADRILKASQGGHFEVLAGSGEPGLRDGTATEAAFCGPQGVTAGSDGTVYVADTTNAAVRMIRDGQVTTILQQTGELTIWPVSPTGLLLSDGKLYVCDPFAHMVYIIEIGQMG